MSTKTSNVTVDGRDVRISNPDKVLYPQTQFTKSAVVDYYLSIAPVLLPHVRKRPLTRIRYPNGTDSASFYEKNAPASTPDWVHTELVASPGSTKNRAYVNYVFAGDAACLAWLANLAALELHVPQWRFNGDPDDNDRHPDCLVADLDPGPPAGLEQCTAVALRLRERFADDGLTAYVKSSGKKGLHVYCPIAGSQSHRVVSTYVKTVARDLQDEFPDQVTSIMAKDQRDGKVFIDWSQNNSAKTTVAPYSLRNRTDPTVSTPLTWAELEAGISGQFSPQQVLSRITDHGDYFADLLNAGPQVPQ